MAALGVAHMLVNLQGLRAVEDQLEEIGRDVVSRLPWMDDRAAREMRCGIT